jgi:hypothetical protein
MKKLIKILVLVLLIPVANALPTGEGEFRLKIYLNNLYASLREDEKILN